MQTLTKHLILVAFFKPGTSNKSCVIQNVSIYIYTNLHIYQSCFTQLTLVLFHFSFIQNFLFFYSENVTEIML